MFGFCFVKFQPSEYILRYRKGKLVQQGRGLAFYYYKRITSIVCIPVGTTDSPFIFEEITKDFQSVTVQGQLTWRIVEPAQIATLLNFALDLNKGKYVSEDPQKLSQRIINIIHVLSRKYLSEMVLKDAIMSTTMLADSVIAHARSHDELKQLGIELMGLSILAVQPNKETARALEAQAREQILRQADDAVYTRRNSAIEQERKIKENEFNTDIAAELKKREIRDAQLEAERSEQEKINAIKAEGVEFDTNLENKRKELVELTVLNEKSMADSKAYALEGIMKALESVNPAIIQALTISNITPGKLAALALQGFADNAEKIGTLSITPDLISELMKG